MMVANVIPILTGLLLLLLSLEATAQKCSIADLGFILDSSGSLARDYQKEKEFLKQIAARIDISPDQSHARVVTFSNEAELSIKSNEHCGKESIEDAVDEIQVIKLYARLELGPRDELVQKSNGSRSDVKKVLVLITNGFQVIARIQVIQASSSMEYSVNIVLVGVGSGKNPQD